MEECEGNGDGNSSGDSVISCCLKNGSSQVFLFLSFARHATRSFMIRRKKFARDMRCSFAAAESAECGIESRLQAASCAVLSFGQMRKHQESDNSVGKFAIQAKQLMKEISVLERAAIGAAAGGIAGAFTYACLHPLDTVKTKIQTRGASDIYSSSLDVAVKILQTKGIAGFYSGISAVLVGSMLSSAVYFGTCELGKSLLSRVPKLPKFLIPPLAGATGNIVSSAILVPKEVITQRMQAGAKGRSWNVLLQTLDREGVKGLYVGYSAALLRNLPAGVISFSTFEYLRAGWLRMTLKESLEPWQSVSSGALAGAIAAGLTTPLDVVKTRLMTQARAAADGGLRSKVVSFTYEGVCSTLKRIWVEEGWVGVSRGIGPRLLHSACFSAIGFFAFETARIAILKHHISSKQASQLPDSAAASAIAI